MLEARTVRVTRQANVARRLEAVKRHPVGNTEVMGLRHEDFDLAARMIAGDEQAFEYFSDHHIPALHRFASRRLNGDRELTREMVQSTVCKAISKLDTYRGGSALMTWLCAICRTEIAQYFRKRGRRGIEVELEEETIATRAQGPNRELSTPESSTLAGEEADLVHVVLEVLPKHYGRVLEWKYLEGFSVKAMAKRLEMTPKATESLLTRARRSFRQRYEELISVGGFETERDTENKTPTGAES